MITYVKELHPEDYIRLREAVGWKGISQKQAQRAIEHTEFIVCAQNGEQTIGMGRIMFDYGYTAYIGDVIVMPEYQGQGIGTYIVDELMKEVLDVSDIGDQIMFILGSARGKEHFYQKLGFELRPSEKYGAGMVKWMQKA